MSPTGNMRHFFVFPAFLRAPLRPQFATISKIKTIKPETRRKRRIKNLRERRNFINDIVGSEILADREVFRFIRKPL